jgi:hypothetical protein
MVIAAASLSASAEQLVGRYFAIGNSSGGNVLYTQKAEYKQQPDGTTLLTAETLDNSGKVLIREKAVLNGSQLVTQEIQNLNDKKEYRGSFKDNVMTFETYSVDDKGESKKLSSHTEKVSDDLITGPLAENFIADHWDKLNDGKRFTARLAVFEREETIGFSFKKKADTEVDGKPAVIIVMRPTSVFVSMVVSPMEIVVDKESRKVVHYTGRTPLKEKDDKILNAEIVYERGPTVTRATASEKPAVPATHH